MRTFIRSLLVAVLPAVAASQDFERVRQEALPPATLKVKVSYYGRPYTGAAVRAGGQGPVAPGADGIAAFSLRAGATEISVKDTGTSKEEIRDVVTLQGGPNERDYKIDQILIKAADVARKEMLGAALAKIDSLLQKEPGEDAGAPPMLSEADQKVVDAMAAWMLTPQVNVAFWLALHRARDVIAKNQALSGKPPYFIDENKTDAFAYVADAADPSSGVYFTPLFFKASFNCRREGILHEYFHLALRLGTESDGYRNTAKPEEALKSAHNLAEVVSQIGTGVILGCERDPD